MKAISIEGIYEFICYSLQKYRSNHRHSNSMNLVFETKSTLATQKGSSKPKPPKANFAKKKLTARRSWPKNEVKILDYNAPSFSSKQSTSKNCRSNSYRSRPLPVLASSEYPCALPTASQTLSSSSSLPSLRGHHWKVYYDPLPFHRDAFCYRGRGFRTVAALRTKHMWQSAQRAQPIRECKLKRVQSFILIFSGCPSLFLTKLKMKK